MQKPPFLTSYSSYKRLAKTKAEVSQPLKKTFTTRLSDGFEKTGKLIGNMLLISGLLLMMILFLYNAIYPKYYLTSAELPQSLIDKGINGHFVQSLILEDIQDIMDKSEFRDPINGTEFIAEGQDDFKMEYEGFSLGSFLSQLTFSRKTIQTNIYIGRHKLDLWYEIKGKKTNSFITDDQFTEQQETYMLCYQEALDILRQISPLTVANYAYRQKDYTTCVAEIDQILKTPIYQTEFTKICDLMGRVNTELAHYEAAKFWIRKGLTADKNNDLLRLNLVNLYNQLKNTNEASVQLDSARSKENHIQTDAWYNMAGNLQLLKHNYTAAIKNYKEAINLNQDFNYEVNLGAAYASARIYDSATIYLDKGYREQMEPLFNSPDLGIGLYNSLKDYKAICELSVKANYKYGIYITGHEFLTKGDEASAIDCFNRCLDQDSIFVPSLVRLAEINQNHNNLEQSNILYETANKHYPYNNYIYSGLVYNYYNQGDIKKSRDLAEDLFSTDHINPANAVLLANFYSFSINTKQLADYYFTWALMLNPHNQTTLKSYRTFKAKVKDFNGVITLSNQLLSFIPTDADAIKDINWAVSQINKLKKHQKKSRNKLT